MGQGYWLGLLQMCKSWHIRIQMVFHDVQKPFHQRFRKSVDFLQFVPAVQLHVKSYLVIPAAASVKLLPWFADPFYQIGFYK